MVPFSFEEFFGVEEPEISDASQRFPIIGENDSVFDLTDKQKNSLDLTARIDWTLVDYRKNYTIAQCQNKYNKKVIKRLSDTYFYDGYYDFKKVTDDFYSNFNERIKGFSFDGFVRDIFSCVGNVSPKWRAIFNDKMFFNTVKSFLSNYCVRELDRIEVDDEIIHPICFRADLKGKIGLDLINGYGDIYLKSTKEKSGKVYLDFYDFIKIMFINDIVLGNRAKTLLPISVVKEIFGEYSSFFGHKNPSKVVLDAIDWLIVLSLLRWNCWAELMSFIFVEKDYKIARACMLDRILSEYGKKEDHLPYIWLYPSETSPIFVKCKN